MRTPRPGSLISGKYRVERVLRQSRMSVVVVAKHRHLGSLIAIKLLRGETARDAGSVARFLREGQLASLLKSEHVVRILDVGVADDDGTPFIAMEFLDGSDVAAAILSSRGMPTSTAAALLIDGCEAIVEAHAMGIVHRDIKPSNLFITRGPDGAPVVKVLDFGIASAITSPDDVRMTSTQDILGTPLYMSPEVMESALKADARSDIWALGATLYEMLTGRVPFEGLNMVEVYALIARGTMTPPRKVKPEISEAVEAVVLRCLARDPEERFPGVVEFVEALAKAALPEAEATSRVERIRRIATEAALRANQAREIVATSPGTVDTYGPAVSRVTALARRARKNATGIAVGTALVIVLAVAGVLFLRERPPRSSGPAASLPTVPSVSVAATPTSAMPSASASAADSASLPAPSASSLATVSSPSPEAAIPSAAPAAPASAKPRPKPTGTTIPRQPPESDFATDPHR
ncbi:MAG: serine/threonine protein kinase [Deltaproteobacteria bacterium]|nr:serine/threonine protein kinase [Deltaproteobacteria bacterium]